MVFPTRYFCAFLLLLPAAEGTVNAGSTKLVGWGGQIELLIDGLRSLTNITTVSLGHAHSLALTADGQVHAAGMNSRGQTAMPEGLSNMVAVAAGAYHSLALRSDGTVVGWGANDYGQATPPAGLSNVVAIAAGDNHSVALRSNGLLVVWGQKAGIAPEVPPDCTDIVQITAGNAYSLALRRDGVVIRWGFDMSGTPRMLKELTGVVELDAGGYHSLALKQDGTVVAWGTEVPTNLAEVVSIEAATDHSLALKADGTVVAWGGNHNGQSTVPAGLSNVVAIAAGLYCSVAVVHEGAPSIAIQPQDAFAYTGTTAVMRATVIGERPLFWQWQRAGTNVASGTNEVLTLQNVRVADAGTYGLIVSNALGMVVSSNAVLTVQAGSPVIELNPFERSWLPGSNAFLSARVSGSEPIHYTWQFNGEDLPDATNSWLTVREVALTNEGDYRLVASNAYGTATSACARLTVADVPGAFNGRNLSWTNGGWSPQDLVSYRDGAALRAFPMSFTTAATLETTVSGRCTLSFWWRIDGGGLLQFSIDYPGFSMQVGATIPWKKQTFYLEEGAHALKWTFNGSYSQYAYLDELTIIPGGSPPLVTSPLPQLTVSAGTNATFSASAEGHAPISYQWQFEGSDIPGATNKMLTITNVQAANAGAYTVRVANPYGVATAGGVLSVIPAAPTVWVPPMSQTAVTGGICVFTVTAQGSDPAYQWRLNGTPIEGATNSQLILSGVSEEHAGNYSVVLSNAYGTAVSSNVTLSLVSSKLIAWGANIFGERSVPATLSNVATFTAGYNTSAAVDETGKITSWGFPGGYISPTPTGVVAIALAFSGMVALQKDGKVVASSTTLRPPAGVSNLVSIAAGSSFCAALRQDGTVVAWGDNTYGQTDIPANLSNVVEVSCGPKHCLAVREDGSVVAWGDNSKGLTNVPPEATNLLTVAAGGYHNLALRRDGVVLAWGDTNSTAAFVPVDLTNVVAIDAGLNYALSMAVRCDGTLVVWGNNAYGLTNPPLTTTNVIGIAAGGAHCLALLGDGAPHLCRPLANQTADIRSTVTFNCSVVGNWPLQYQWQFNGVDISDATNALLVIRNLSGVHAGTYRCRVSNSIGVVSTGDARLTVRRQPLAFALQAGALHFSKDGLHLNLLNLTGSGSVVIEVSDDLQHWQPILTNPPAIGILETIDTEALGHSQRFYRALEVGH